MNLKTEKKLWKQGYKIIAGIDEAGRGPLAGPVVASAVVILSDNFNKNILKLINDSKQLSKKQREQAFEAIKAEPNIYFGIGKVSEKIIDKINIWQATKLAMKKAIDDLIKKTVQNPDFLILDGKHKIDVKIKQDAVIKADAKIFSCSAASIIAKVTRDKIMDGLHKKYPQYGFDKHKGYGTKEHFKMTKKYGPCKIHRQTFAPIKNMI